MQQHTRPKNLTKCVMCGLLNILKASHARICGKCLSKGAMYDGKGNLVYYKDWKQNNATNQPR